MKWMLCALLLAGCGHHHEGPAPGTQPPAGQAWLSPQQIKDAQISVQPVGIHNVGGAVVTSGKVTFDDLRVSHVFVSHTHVDHFVGFDQLLRVLLGRKRELVLSGGPGFIAQVEHKLRAYTWNVVHRYEMELMIEAREFDPEGQRRCARFSSRRAFAREPDARFDAFQRSFAFDRRLLPYEIAVDRAWAEAGDTGEAG